LESIGKHCQRSDYRLVVGANAAGDETLEFLKAWRRNGQIDRLVVSPTNINKCPMMRRMFTGIRTEFIWWFDDDSYFTHSAAFSKWLTVARAAPPSTVMWGCPAVCNHPDEFTCRHDVLSFVRNAKWYRGLPPPSPRPGGKGEFDFEGRGKGDGRWFFLVGGCWLIRTRAVRTLHWPDRRLIKMGDDVFLGEAVRQHGWRIAAIQSPGIAINTEPRRGLMG
jgi:GT2 family glycosyltransferase